MHALRRKVLARGLHVLGGDTQTSATSHSIRVVEAGRYRHTQPAPCDAEIDRLIQAAIAPMRAVFEQHILAGDTELRRTVLNVGRYV